MAAAPSRSLNSRALRTDGSGWSHIDHVIACPALIASDGVRAILTGRSGRRAKPISPFSSRAPAIWASLP